MHLCGLGRSQRRGGLVHDQRACVEVDRARDGDRLALSAGQPEHRALEILEVRIEPADDLARRGLHRRVVERAATGELPAEEDVRRRVEVVRERKRLIDGLDPERLRIARIADRDRLAADEDLSRVRRTRAG